VRELRVIKEGDILLTSDWCGENLWLVSIPWKWDSCTGSHAIAKCFFGPLHGMETWITYATIIKVFKRESFT